MRNKLLLTFVIMLTGVIVRAQLSGDYSIPGAVFPTVASAIDSLNEVGVTTPGVTFNIAAGYTETFDNPSMGVISTSTGSAVSPIVFQKSGTGLNPLLMAGTGKSTSTDAIFTISGTDYVTFDGINVVENPANTTSTTRMEFGYWLARESATNGTQHCTIKNLKVSGMARGNSIGSTAKNINNATINPTSAAGANSYNKIYADTLDNSFIEWNMKSNIYVYFIASSTVSTNGFWDEGNEIGVDGGNVFLNGMYLKTQYQRGLKVANNLFKVVDSCEIKNQSLIYTSGCFDLSVYNNTITEILIPASYALKVISAGSTGSLYVYDNVIHNINFSNATSGSFTGIESSMGAVNIRISGNTISNIAYGGATTTGTFLGIGVVGGNMNAGSFCSVYDNVISDNSISSGSATAEHCFIKDTYYALSSGIYNNLITDNSTSCIGLIHGIDARSITANLLEKKIYGNTISDMTNTNGTFYGIRHAYGLSTSIYQNRVSNISSTGTSDPVINGITVENANTAAVAIYNNYITELRTSASSGTRQITGLNIVAGQVVDINSNTIFIDATSTGTDFGTAGIFCNTTTILKLRNNLIDNKSVPAGSGKTVALQFSGTPWPNYDPASNNNNYYAGVPGPDNLIFSDGTNSDQTLVAFQLRVMPAENASITENTTFVNTSSSPYDMHIELETASECENGGLIITTPEPVTVDYYGTPRYPNPGYPVAPPYYPTRPDIGAEEFGGSWSDHSAPTVNFAPLPNTGFTTDRVLTATFIDLSGVPIAGDGLPVLKWNVNNGSWNSVTGVYLDGNLYSFTFGGGVALNDSVKYFIVAQDVNAVPGPNVGSTPVGADGLTINPPACTTPPTKLFSYKIANPKCGTYYVGAGGDYATLTSAINDLNTSSMTCPVTLLLTDSEYLGETFPIYINAIPGLNATNTLTISPAPGVNAVVTGSNAAGLIIFFGSRYVTIDGSNCGGSDRSLMFHNSNTTTNATVLVVENPGAFGASSSDITIKNCKVKASPQVQNVTYGIKAASPTGGGGYTNLVIDNNEILSTNLGIRIQGTLAYPATNCRITNNIVGSTVHDSLSTTQYGIYVLYCDNVLIEGNEVIGPSIDGNTNVNQSGIRVFTRATNTRVLRNIVHGFNSIPYGIYGAFGIYYRAEANSVTEISNNVVYDIKGTGATSIFNDLGGILLLSGGNIKVWDNTVNLTGACLSSSAATKSGCIIIANPVFNIDMRNNILKNSLQPVSGAPASKTFAIYSAGGAGAFSALDNNDYFVDGIGANIAELNSTSDYSTLASWQSVTAMEANSLDIDPAFVSETNLQTNVPALNNAGVTIAEVTTDITGALRTAPPDMGAYEFALPVADINTLAAGNITPSTATLNGNISTSGEVVAMSFEYGLTNNYGNSVTAQPAQVRSLTPADVSANLTGLVSSTVYHFRLKGVSATSAEIVYGSDRTFTTLMNVPDETTVQNVTVAEGHDTCFNATEIITVAGNGTTFVVQSGANVDMIAGRTIYFRPGTKVDEGGFMHGYITETEQYCGYAAEPMVAVKSGIVENQILPGSSQFKLYPNPTTEEFTLEMTGKSLTEKVSVEIFGIRGNRVVKTGMEGQNIFKLSLSGEPVGVYFVRLVSGETTEILKIIKK